MYVLLDTTVSTSATCTKEAADRYGWMMLGALGVREKFYNVNMPDGGDTTVATQRTCQYHVIVTHRTNTQVHNLTIVIVVLKAAFQNDKKLEEEAVTTHLMFNVFNVYTLHSGWICLHGVLD